MSLVEFALSKRRVMWVLIVLLTVAGFFAYQKLGKLENPDFVIKIALVMTQYPGASASEVEEEVTEKIEEAIQTMGELKRVYSTSQDGISVVYAEMKDHYTAKELPNIWTDLRKYVNDVQHKLPPGAGPSMVMDDFGDVYGVFYAITGEGKSFAELEDYAIELKKELLLCPGVAKIDFWGVQPRCIYVETDIAQAAAMGITPPQILSILQSQNLVESSGSIRIDDRMLRITPTGGIQNEASIENLMLGDGTSQIRLGNFCRVYRDYVEPASNMMRYNSKNAIGIGIATVEGGNVIEMGVGVKQRLAELAKGTAGFELQPIYIQSDMVTAAIENFIISLAESVVIVILLLMLFMGFQSGLLIGIVLLLNILMTFVGMDLLAVDLQKISLGALILALGMLVDNAIVVADGILVRVQRGQNREEAAMQTVRDTRWALLGATLIAVLAFAAIGYAPGNIGEFCRSLFTVMALSLIISWVLAVTVTPLFCVVFLRIPPLAEGETCDPYGGLGFRLYRRGVHYLLRFRWLTLAAVMGIMIVSIVAFTGVSKSLFAESTQPFFFVNIWGVQGMSIDKTSAAMREMEGYIRQKTEVQCTTSFVGEGALRFLLSYDYQSANSCYGQLMVEVKDYRQIPKLISEFDRYFSSRYPDIQCSIVRVPMGPAVSYKIETRFRGPDSSTLRKLAAQAEKIMRETPNTRDVCNDWRQEVPTLQPIFSEAQARRVGITRSDLATSLQWYYPGIISGVMRENEHLLPIIFRSSAEEHHSLEAMQRMSVFSTTSDRVVPLRQVVSGVGVEPNLAIIKRRQRQKTITAQCNPIVGLADPLRLAMEKQIEAIPLPPGYTLEWAGEYEKSKEGEEPMAFMFPICAMGMFLLGIFLFNSLRRTLIIFLMVPFSIIGVTWGLILTGESFGFMTLLGFLGLSGMILKNGIVLVDQIDIDLNAGKAPYQAVLDSSVSRLRPVTMAAGTTILGMIPLIWEPMYASMAAAIMGGLFAATFLTLILLPICFCILFRIKSDSKYL